LAHFDHHFTYVEAIEMIPWVQGVFRNIHRVLHSLEFARGTGSPFAENYGVSRADDRQIFRLLEKTSQLMSPEAMIESLSGEDQQELLKGLVRGLKEKGILVQDVRRGLIDFPAWKDGREVLLCYELADGDHLRHWHELDVGYAGRQEIEEDDDL
jgi:hypothetical protein